MLRVVVEWNAGGEFLGKASIVVWPPPAVEEKLEDQCEKGWIVLTRDGPPVVAAPAAEVVAPAALMDENDEDHACAEMLGDEERAQAHSNESNDDALVLTPDEAEVFKREGSSILPEPDPTDPDIQRDAERRDEEESEDLKREIQGVSDEIVEEAAPLLLAAASAWRKMLPPTLKPFGKL